MIFPSTGLALPEVTAFPPQSGGIDLVSPPDLLADGKLSEATNMWWKDGVLKSRPGTDFREISSADIGVPLFPTRFRATGVTVSVGSSLYALFWSADHDSDADKTVFTLLLVLISGDGAPLYASTGLTYGRAEDGAVRAFSGADGKFYIMWKPKNDSANIGLRLAIKGLSVPTVELLSTSDVYVPTVYKGAYTLANSAACPDIDGQVFEEPNMLCPRYRMTFTMFNPDARLRHYDISGTDGVDCHFMIYPLARPLKKDSVLTATVRRDGVSVTHTLTYSADVGTEVYESDYGTDGLKMSTSGRNVVFDYRTDGHDPTTVSRRMITYDNSADSHYYCNNERENLTVEAEFDRADGFDKVSDTALAVWYSGASSGSRGGTRLFCSGSSSEPNMICWSAAGDPLYFPENNYATVGDGTTAVTALAKQGSMLVIFKEHETYCTESTSGLISASDVTGGIISGNEIAGSVFPIYGLDSLIGCDAPETVALADGHLVWASSSGEVYTLSSLSLAGERSIKRLSARIAPLLHGRINECSSAVSFDGYYCLFCGSDVFLADLDSPGFIKCASGVSAEEQVAWYRWRIPECAVSLGARLGDGIAAVCAGSEGDRWVRVFSDKATDTVDGDELPVAFSAVTKSYTLGAPHAYKSIEKAVLITSGKSPSVSFVTERGETAKKRIEDGKSDSRALRVPVCLPRVRRLGVRISGEGKLALEGVYITSKTIGDIR